MNYWKSFPQEQKIADLNNRLHDFKSRSYLSSKSRKKNIPARVAGEDETYLLEKGYTNEIIALEQSIGKRTRDNMTILCGFNISRLADEDINALLETIISCHGYVIIDEPFRVYAAAPNRIEVRKRRLGAEHR